MSSSAGTGSLSVDQDVGGAAVHLTALFRYAPAPGDIEDLSESLQEASEILCDATEGFVRIGRVTLKSGGCESGDCRVGDDAADLSFSPTQNEGAQSSICPFGRPCSALGRLGAQSTFTRRHLTSPVTIAHELGHYILNLADGYRQYDCAPHRPPYGRLFEELTSTHTSLMMASELGTNQDYTELTTMATLPGLPQQSCLPLEDVFLPGGECEVEDRCDNPFDYLDVYDGFRNETSTDPEDDDFHERFEACLAFDPALCEYTWSATQWYSFYTHGEVLPELDQAARNLEALSGGIPIIEVITQDLPNPEVPSDRAEFCSRAVEIDNQVRSPNEVILLLDRSYSMAFPRSTEFEKCDPDEGCQEVCDNGIDDDEDGVIDEDDDPGTTDANTCATSRMDAMKSLSRDYLTGSDPADNIAVGIQSFACDWRIDAPQGVIDIFSVVHDNAINGLEPNGSTAIGDSLLAASGTFQGEGNRSILLVTDGFNTCGDPDIQGAILELVDQGISVDAITFGTAVANPEAAEIAARTGGNFISVPTATDLGPAFARQWAHQVGAAQLIPMLPYHVANPAPVPGVVLEPGDGIPQVVVATTQPEPRVARVSNEVGFIAPHYGSLPTDLASATSERYDVLVESGVRLLRITLSSSEDRYESVGIRARLEGPTGPGPDLLDTDDPGSHPTFSVLRTPSATHISLEAPNPGLWSIFVEPPTDPGLDDEQFGYITVLARSDGPSLTASLSQRLVLDRETGTTLTGYARFGTATIEGASAMATLVRPDGSVVELDVRSGVEFAAGGYFADLKGELIDQPGRYEVRLNLFGTPSATRLVEGDLLPTVPLPTAFERTAIESFWVLDATGHFACDCAAEEDCDNDGVFFEAADVDTDGDGLFNACDPDSDNDEIDDGRDNPGGDLDQDGIDDELDSDADGDGTVDSEDPNLDECNPPIVIVDSDDAHACESDVTLGVSLRSGEPVLRVTLPISLSSDAGQLLAAVPGVDAVQAGLVEFTVDDSEIADNKLTVSLRFPFGSPLPATHSSRIVELLVAPAAGAPDGFDVCPFFLDDDTQPTVRVPGRRPDCSEDPGPGFQLPVTVAALPVCGELTISDADVDADGVGDRCDNCPFNGNPLQQDVDEDGRGDECDGVTAACADGFDNDGDGLSDADDPGCESSSDSTETSGDLECDNGIDEDFDGFVDTADEDCTSPLDESETPEPIRCVTVTGDLALADNALIAGADVHAGQHAELGVCGTILGDLLVGGDATFRGQSWCPVEIDGDVTLAGELDSAGGHHIISGALTEGATVSPPEVMSESVAAGTTNDFGCTRSLLPGDYGTVETYQNCVLTLQSGTYNFREFRLFGDSQLALDLSLGPVIVRSQQDLVWGDRVIVSDHLGAAIEPADLTLYTNQTHPVQVGTDSWLVGEMIAPAAQITIHPRGEFEGCVKAAHLRMEPHAELHGGNATE